MLDLEVVQYDQSTVGNSYTQAPLDLTSRMLRPLTMILFDASVYPLACGCATEVNNTSIFLHTIL